MSSDFGPIQWFDWDAVVREDGKNLPHLSQRDAVYFITFRLWDSIPTDVLSQLKARRDHWLAANPEPHTPEQARDLKRIYSLPLERYLDEGHGRCIFRDRACRDELERIMLHVDGKRYRLGDYVVMPNHVHLLLQTHTRIKMTRTCWRWKNLSSTKINRILRRRGHLWQSEAFDHIVRSPEQLEHCRRYIQLNPRYLRSDKYTLGCGTLFGGPTPVESVEERQENS